MTDKLQIMADGLVQNLGNVDCSCCFCSSYPSGTSDPYPLFLIMHGGYLLLQAVLPMCL